MWLLAGFNHPAMLNASIGYEHTQKLTPYLFQNYVALYLNFTEIEKMSLISTFGASLSQKRLIFSMEKERIFLADQVKSYAFNKCTRDCS